MPDAALRQQWEKTGKEEPRRFLCERCGGMGEQEAGCFNTKTRKYDSKAGVCEHCNGEGYLGFMPQRKFGDGTIGSAPCEINLNKILIATDNKRVTNKVMARYQYIKNFLAKMEEHLMQDKDFYNSVLYIFRDAQMEVVDGMKEALPLDVYSHFRCCVVGLFRNARNKIKEHTKEC